MFIIENITDIFLPIWTLWVRCAWCLDLHTSVFRIWNLNLRTFVAKYWRGDLRTFWRKILKARFTRICRETFTPGFTHFFCNFFFYWNGGSANFFAFRMYVRNFPFKVVKEGGRIKIQVEHRGKQKTFFPEEISSFVLSHMKDIAECHLETRVAKT